MEITTLFDIYKEMIATNSKAKTILAKSGMIQRYKKLDFGFFPLGSGILTDKSKIDEASIKSCDVMVLGNDFGTETYLKDKCKNNRENNSKTIANLQKVGLKIDKTFFTNFFLGLRDDVSYKGMTMTKLAMPRQDEYRDLCFEFFKSQLDFMKPKTVLCLGSQVGQTLSELSPVFANFATKKTALSTLFADTTDTKYIVHSNDKIFGKRKYVLIPHPSYAHINWKKNDIENKIKSALQN